MIRHRRFAWDRRLSSYRLVAFVFPSHLEGVLSRFTGWAYSRSESGAWGWLGDRADAMRTRIGRARAWWHWCRDGRP